MMRQLAVFFLLAYLISWTIWIPLWLPAFGGSLPVWPYHHAWGGFGPMAAAFITIYIFEKRGGLAVLWKSMFAWKPVLHTVIALVSPFLLMLLAGFIRWVAEQRPPDFSGVGISREFPTFDGLTFFFYNLLFFGWGEETGWRGFALPRLQSRYNALTATLILTFFWALWHWPLFFYRPGYVSMDTTGVAGWLFSIFTGSVLLTWLFNASRGSVLACAIFHATIDIAFTSDFSEKGIVSYIGALITIWGIFTIIWFKTKNLAQTKRVTKL